MASFLRRRTRWGSREKSQTVSESDESNEQSSPSDTVGGDQGGTREVADELMTPSSSGSISSEQMDFEADETKQAETDDNPEWIDDEEVAVCMICPATFGIFTRKHHCRKCGYVVCRSCSLKELDVKGEACRVCDVCFEKAVERGDVGGSVINSTLSSISSGISSVGSKLTSIVPTFRDNDPKSNSNDLKDGGEVSLIEDYDDLPWWLYMMKPFSREGSRLAVGALRVRVKEAKYLPVMDMFSSDPYCQVYLDQPAGKEHSKKTDIKKGTLNPQWDEQYKFHVHTTLCNLRVDVFDYDIKEDDFIGHVSIPLSTLSHVGPTKKWYDLILSDDLRIEAAQKKRAKKESKKDAKKNKKKQVYTSGRTPQIYLEMTYKFNKFGEFASHFLVQTPPPPSDQAFDMDIFYNNAMELLELTTPLTRTLGEVNHVLQWTDPFLSCCVLIPFVLGCYYPWLFPIMFQLWIIRYMFWQYVLKKWKERDPTIAVHINKSTDEQERERLKREAEDDIEVKKLEDKKKKEREVHLNGLLVGVSNMTMAAGGMKETLKWLQNLMGWINGMLKFTYGLFQWKQAWLSKYIMVTLCCTLIYSLIFPFQYVALLIGVYIICMWTVPVKVLWWFCLGFAMYFARSKPNQKTPTLKATQARSPRSPKSPSIRLQKPTHQTSRSVSASIIEPSADDTPSKNRARSDPSSLAGE